MLKPLILLLVGAAGLQLLLVSCGTTESWVVLPNLSPPVATVVGRSLDQAEEIAKTVPNSFVLISHGTVRFAMYPPGTALVVQAIEWDNLRSGMTAIYYIDQQLSAALTGGVLTHKEDGVWHVPGIEDWHPPGTGKHVEVELVTKSRYAGVVVAAFMQNEQYDPLVMLRSAPSAVAGTCVLRCHVPPTH